MPPDVQIAFYRITQESFNNIAKHAQATQAALRVRKNITFRVSSCFPSKVRELILLRTLNFDCMPEQAILSISDNGRGFDINHVPAGHFGLTIMGERAAKIGATLEIEAQPGRGVVITLVWEGSDWFNLKD